MNLSSKQPESPQPSEQDEKKRQHFVANYHQEWMRRAGQITGFLYIAGDIAFMAHARKVKKGGGTDMLKATRAATYLLGNLILLAYTGKSDKNKYSQKQCEKIERNLYEQADQAGLSSDFITRLREKVEYELHEHPWEVAYLLYATGASLQGTSALRQKRYMEAAGSLGTLTAMLLPVFIAEEGQKPFIQFSDHMQQTGHQFIDSYNCMKDNIPMLNPAFGMCDFVAHQVTHHPLRLGAVLSIAANSLHMKQAFKSKPLEKWLASSAGLYLAGNIITGFASKNMDEKPIDWEKEGNDLSVAMSSNEAGLPAASAIQGRQ